MLTGAGMRNAVRRQVRAPATFAVVVAWIMVWAAGSLAVPPGFSNESVVPGITSATTIAFLPDGRMLVGELTGAVWVVQPGASAPDPTPFLQIDYSQLFGEQGLMDILLDPNFAVNQYYYVFYTRGFPGSQNHNRLSRFTASGSTTLPGSEFVLWQDDQVAQDEHHGGGMAIGPDGKLYFAYGEQFFPSDSQNLGSYRGKLMRINLDGTIPTDNPFYDGPGQNNKDEIWAYGLRNPFRISSDPVTGHIFIGDVGGNNEVASFEEINLAVRGANYGWPMCDGPCALSGITNPIYAYPHNGRDACVTGGFVYRGTQFPAEYVGSYFFADYVQNWIKRLTFDGNGNVAGVENFEPIDGSPDGPYGDPVKLLQGPDGSLYYVDIGFNDQHVPNEASIRRIRYTLANQPPVAVATASPRSGLAPLQVTFSSAGSSDPEGMQLSYSWAFGDGATSTLPNPVHVYAADGPYLARLTVSDGVNQTISNDIAISVGNAPTATILTPSGGSLFRAGDVIPYSGDATDLEDGTLPASAFSWTILFHHDTHIHPGGTFTNTKTGTLVVPTTGHDFQGATSYEIILTVTDSNGLQGTDSVTVFPEKVNLSFTSQPSGLGLEVDGIRTTAPFTLGDVIGFVHTIQAPTQSLGSRSYVFESWSDGGASSHSIVVPAGGGSWRARFGVSETPADLVAAYSFDEGVGNSLGDASGKGNDGSILGATWTPGKFGMALSFDGSSTLVNIPGSNSLDLTNGMTLEAWVYPTAPMGDFRDVIYKGQNDNYYLEGSSPGFGGPAVGGTFTSPLISPAGALPLNAWSHVAATYDGAFLRLFVNGVLVNSRAQTGAIQTSTGPLTLGGDPLYGQYFAGRIDEVRIFSRALSVAEIQADMQKPVTLADVPAISALGVGTLAVGLLVAGLRGMSRRRR